MRILILPSWYFEAGRNDIGGRNFHVLAKGLREHEIDAQIFYAHFSTDGPIKKTSTFQIEEGVPTWRVKQWFPPKIFQILIHRWIHKYVHEISHYIKQEGKPDIIHAQSYLAAIVACEIREKWNIPLIYTEHLSRLINNEIPARHKALISLCCDTASHITCVSPGLKSNLQAYTTRDIEVVPNFYDPDIFHFDPSIQKSQIFTWISIGEPSHVKGLDILIKAFGIVKQKLPDTEMQLIFIDDIMDKGRLIQLAKKNKIDQWIKWTGLIPQDQIAEILQHSHALISSSRVETFGTVIIEAQACGLPVICTRTDGAVFILSSPDQGILVNTNDAEGLANAMIDMYETYNRYNSQNIVNAVSSRFSKDVVIFEWKKLYQGITG